MYAEGGGNKATDSDCRRAFHVLLTTAGFTGRLPTVFPCGPRNEAFDDFKTALRDGSGNYPMLLVDSEEPVAESNQPAANPSGAWLHLAARDGWERPSGAQDDQAQLMVTTMETWLAADRNALAGHFPGMNANALPPDADLESRLRQDVLGALQKATGGRYRKGRDSFDVLSKVYPTVLQGKLPHFQRFIGDLNAHA